MRNVVLILATAALAGCGGSGGAGGETGPVGGAAGALGGSAGTGQVGGAGAGSGGIIGIGGIGGATGTGAGAGAGSGGGNGSAEVCDGIDNDGNGIIDDVDVGADGVCDCLRIATLGIPGTWGLGDVFKNWLNSRSNNGAADLGSQVLTAELLSRYQVIVAQDVSQIGRIYSADEVAALSDWVQRGGGLMTLIGYHDSSERTNANTLLSPFGIDYAGTSILQKRGANTVPITQWRPHPTTSGISAVGMANGYAVEGTGTTIAIGESTSGSTSGTTYIVGAAQTAGKGRVFAWGDEWITYNTEWQSHPDYQVELFWLNIIKWLTPVTECQVAIPPNIR